MPKQCPKCSFDNTATDPELLVECPQCKLVYAKYDPALVKRSEEANQKRLEEKRRAEEELIQAQRQKDERRQRDEAARRLAESRKQQVIVKTYKGTQAGAMALFQSDAKELAALGYVPTSQTWAPGAYGCGSFLVALLLCVVLVGIVIFIYMLLVKPDGTLSVTYELRSDASTTTESSGSEKVCPQCAEHVKAAALICRFCGHKFS